jgi:hypothetical protein
MVVFNETAAPQPGAAFVEIYNRTNPPRPGLAHQWVDYEFSGGTVLAPGQHLILAMTRAPAAYGTNIPVQTFLRKPDLT